tara:strand:+ start:2124 stop:2681 length:558 start_codon:yes stop_codon:yes gene_type:complete
MRPLFIFTFRATKEERALALQWATFTDATEVILHQIPQKNPAEVLTTDDVVITFGRTAASMVEQVGKKLHHATLPPFVELLYKEENTEKRAWARAELEGLKSSLQVEKEIILQKIDTDKIDQQEATYKDLLGNTILLACKSGEVFEINQEGTSEKHTAISFAELFAVKKTMDTLDVKQVRLVRKG